ncbi:hypothetical protein EHS25_009080 [Saitozyma podzolica]|uniref:Uncharacterized protein n=1 Tax=Saitozyma podzolica TaxID=1890683 RepID=A0A427YL00_9TREE|nr:hypothetical protein EHS25_009080 [Saitozyma podzolica]
MSATTATATASTATSSSSDSSGSSWFESGHTAMLATLALIALLTLALAWWYYLGGKLPCQDKEPNCSKCGEKIEDSTGRAYTKHWMRKWEVMHGWCADGEGSEVKAEAAEAAA